MLPAIDDTVAPVQVPGLPPLRARAGIPGKVRILVMRGFWNKAPGYPDTGQMKALMKDTATWFRNASRGRHKVTSKVTPWLRLAGGSANCGDRFGSTRRAIAAARARGVDPRAFNRYMIVMPQCGSNSYGEMPGRVTWILESQTHLDVITHELGHNLGLDHANGLICTAQKRRVTQGGLCYSSEYNDLWDAMGISSRPYSVAVLKRLGWAGRIATATSSGTWKLADSEDSGSGIQGLRVKVSRKVSFWLEYKTTSVASEKQPGSFPINGDPGLQVRLDTGRKSLNLVDAAPGNPDPHLAYPDPDFVNVALPVGSSFTTPQRVRITLLSQDGKQAKVRIAWGKAAGVPDAPSLTWAVAAPGYQESVELKIQRGASDNGQVVLGWLATGYPGGKSTFIADPGGTRPTVTVAGGVGAEQWTVRAVNQVGASKESGRVDEHLPAPVLTIASPAPGASVTGPYLHLTVDAKPDPFPGSPVSSMQACLGGGYCEYDAAAPWAFDLLAGGGSHTVVVRALDDGGGEGQVSASYVVVDAPPTVQIVSPAEGDTIPVGSDFTVDANVTANPDTAPVSYVSFRVYAAGSDVPTAYADDYEAPWSGTLVVGEPGDYRIVVEAQDQYYTSAPAVVNVVAQ